MILTTTEQFISVIPTLTSDIEFDDLKTYVKKAERWLKTEILGTNLYDDIDQDSSDTYNSLKDYCIDVIALHAYYEGIPFFDVTQSRSGFGVVSTNNLAPASKERVERLRESTLLRRDEAIEDLIIFLEDNEDFHELWKPSKAFSLLTDTLIYKADEMKEYAKWEGSRLDFIKLRPVIKAKTNIHLVDKISKAYINHLIVAQQDAALSETDESILPYLKFALANYTIDNMEVGMYYLDKAITHMDNNIDDYELYAQSDEYKRHTEYGGHVNKEDDSIFVSNA